MTARTLLVAAAAACVLIGCETPSALTAGAVGCSTGEIEIIGSAYQRSGSTTAWCARCKGKTYNCATNVSRDHAVCREVNPGPPCN